MPTGGAIEFTKARADKVLAFQCEYPFETRAMLAGGDAKQHGFQ